MANLTRLLACTFVLGGCSVEAGAPLPLPDAELEDRVGDLPDEDDLVAQVCAPDHYVTILSSGTQCTDIGKWKGTRLFPTSMFYATAEEDSLPTEMARYCTYEWTGGEAVPWQAFEGNPLFEAATRDCRAITPQGDPIADALAPALRDNFRWLAGRVDATDVDSASSEADRAPTTVAVVDTFPHHEPAKPLSDHGPVMQQVIADIACPDATNCAVDIPAYLGLPRTKDGMNTMLGGYIGLQSDLARAIYVATEQYREAADSGEAYNLIINLSVGWETGLFGDAGTGAAVDSVYVALERARCVGGLPIAAAGNSSGLSCSEEPLAPASWEQELRPTLQRCADLGLTDSAVQDSSGGYSPLVFAAGGLATPTESMPGTRNAGKPRLFAPASHVVAGDPMTPSKTGTSLASAVTSGAAALVWSYHPDLRANDVMQLLYDYGAGTGSTSDFGLPSAGPMQIRRLDVCESLAAACADPGSSCAKVPTLSCNAPVPYTADDLFAIVDGLSPNRDVPNFKGGAGMCNNACGLDAPLLLQSGLTRTCAEVERDPSLFLTNPQPPEPGCTDCVLADDFAALTVSDTRENEELIGVTVDVLDEVTGRHFLYVVDPTMLENSLVTEIELKLGSVVPRTAHIELAFVDSEKDTRDAMILQ